MNKIHDPNLDALFRNGPPVQAGPVLAAPLNDIQLAALLASIIGATTQSQVSPHQAVGIAIDLIAEAILQMAGGALNRALDRARKRMEPTGAVALPTQ